MFYFKDYGAKPSEYAILADYTPPKGVKDEHNKPYSALVGFARSPEGVKTKIAELEKDRVKNPTFGGLIDTGPVWGCKYRVFKATWDEIELQKKGQS